MITFIFLILLLMIFGKIFIFALRATWGVTKILLTVVLLPLFLIGLILKGLVIIALPVLLIAGIMSLFCLHN